MSITGGQGIQVGDHNVQVNYYRELGPLWPILVGNLPQEPDCFQHRPEQDQLIATYFSANTVVLVQVLAGMGGAGKTQLARAFAKTQWDRRIVDLLVWVNANSQDSIISSYAIAAARIGASLPGGTSDLSMAKRFLSWLAEKSDKKWLIVLDDVADPKGLAHLKPPSTDWGHTIITTRALDQTYYAKGWKRLEVGIFTAEQARQYMQNRLSDHPGALTGADKLAEDLGYLPLALASASALIRVVLDSHGRLDGPGSCTEYSDLLADRQRRLVDFMQTEQTDDYDHTLAATWSISIEQVDQEFPSGIAHRLMELLSLLDPNGVPFEILDNPEVHAYLGSPSPEEIRAALRALRLLSLIEFADADSELVRIHMLIQRAVRETARGNLEDAVRALGDSMASHWPEHQHRSGAALLLRSNALALYQTDPGPLQTPRLHPLLFLLGDSYGRAGLMDQAREYFNRLRQEASTQLGPDSRDALHARQRDAYWLGFSGRNEEALREFTELAADQTRVLGPDAKDTLVSRHNIARFTGRSGDPQGAVNELVRLVEDETRDLGPDDNETLKSRNILGYWRSKAGDGPGAVADLEELLTIRIELNGPDHPETLTTRNDLSIAKADIGDFAGAAATAETLAQDRARVLGPEAPETLSSKAYVAYWQAKAGDPGSAAELAVIVSDHVRVLGVRHRNTLRAQAYLIEARAAAGDITIEEATAEMARHLEVIRATIDPTDIVFTHCQQKLTEWQNSA